MIKNLALAASLVAGGMFAVSADAATMWASTVVDYQPGPGNTGPRGDGDGSAALGAPDADWVSLGDGGFIVVGFDEVFGEEGILFEATFNCGATGPNGGCAAWPEAVDVYTGNGWVAGGTLADLMASFTFQTTVANDGTVPGPEGFISGITFPIAGTFSQLALVDVTASIPSSAPRFDSNAGFDVDAIGVKPIPVPATLPLLAAALGGIALLRRRSTAA